MTIRIPGLHSERSFTITKYASIAEIKRISSDINRVIIWPDAEVAQIAAIPSHVRYVHVYGGLDPSKLHYLPEQVSSVHFFGNKVTKALVASTPGHVKAASFDKTKYDKYINPDLADELPMTVKLLWVHNEGRLQTLKREFLPTYALACEVRRPDYAFTKSTWGRINTKPSSALRYSS